MGRFSVSGSFFGESKNDPQVIFYKQNKLHPFTSVGRMGRSGSSGSFFGTPFGAQQKNSKSRCAKHVLGLKLVFALNIACTVFSIFTCILYFIPKFESFRNEKNVHQIF